MEAMVEEVEEEEEEEVEGEGEGIQPPTFPMGESLIQRSPLFGGQTHSTLVLEWDDKSKLFFVGSVCICIHCVFLFKHRVSVY